MQPEARLVKKLTSLVEEEGGVVFKIHGGDNPFQAIGIPDQLCCVYGQFIGIEAKMPGGQLRPAQVVALRAIFLAGGVAAVIDSVEQGRKLLSYCKDRRSHKEAGILFDRGRLAHVWGNGPRR